jgi:protein SCO1/2
MRFAALVTVIGLAVLALGSCADAQDEGDARVAPYEYNAARIDPAVPMPNFALVEADGTEFRLDEQRGKVVAVFFGYTYCPDVCPLTMARMRQAIALLTPEERAQLEVVMVTVDPERDTPEVIGRYISHFDPTFHGLSGEPSTVQDVMSSWGVQVQRTPRPTGDLIEHPASVYVLDREGAWTLSIGFTNEVETIAEDLRHLIAGSPEAASVATSATGAAGRTSLRSSGGVRWFFALSDGSVVMREANGRESTVLPSWKERPSRDTLALGQAPGAREVAYDAASGRLWYADTHEALYSVDVDTGMPGPTLRGFADAALPGCGVVDLSREFALLPRSGELILATLVGTTVLYDGTSQQLSGAFGPDAFGGLLLGQFRLFVADPHADLAWYIDGRGALHEAATPRWTSTDRTVGPLPGAPSGATLEAVIDPTSGYLLYLREDGELAGWDLDRDAPVEPPFRAPPGTRALAAG